MTSNSQKVIGLFEEGWDLVTYKTVRSHEHIVNNDPWYGYVKEITPKKVIATTNIEDFKNTKSLVNSVGIPSSSIDVWSGDIHDNLLPYLKEHPKKIFLLSIYGEGRDNLEIGNDYRKIFNAVKDLEYPICLEMNISCPNLGNAHFYRFEFWADILRSLKLNFPEQKIIIKIPYLDKELLTVFLSKLRIPNKGLSIDGITLLNSYPVVVYNEEGNFFFGKDRFIGGLSGLCIKDSMEEMAQNLCALRKEGKFSFDILVSGGIFQEDVSFAKFGGWGVDAILQCTSLYYKEYVKENDK
ncbi:MAG: hypothetical protein ACE5H1_04625 [Thermodesulfobacteriota bacterium]